MNWKVLFAVIGVLVSGTVARAESPLVADEETGIEELNPFAPGVEDLLHRFDEIYQTDSGRSVFPDGEVNGLLASGCYQQDCAVFVDVDKSSQTLRLYLNGRLSDQWYVSTGMSGFETPDFNKHFNGRIYERFNSSKYPGGDYMGLGNMPYAMFISGGFAIHGTPEANWHRLGRRASHGCIRIHPDNARYLNHLLRQVGVKNSWVLVH